MQKEILRKVPTKGFLRKSTNLKFGVIIKTMDTNAEISNRRFIDTSDLVGRFFDQFSHVYKRFDDIDAQFGRVSEKFMLVDEQFAEMSRKIDQRFANVYSAMSQRFDIIDGRFEVIAQRFDKLEGMVVELRDKSHTTDKRFDVVDRRFDTLEGMISQLLPQKS